MNKRIISFEEYTGLVNDICRQIANSNWRPDYIVGITRGGLFPAVMISQYLNIPMHTLNVSLRDNATDIGPESNLWMAEDAFGYEKDPMNILIVDDINDSGATLNWIMGDWKSGCLPTRGEWNDVFGNNVKFAVIIDNLASKCDVKMNFAGEEINKAEKDVWIEFPYEEWWK